jgi:chromosomal replication initiation ATPase DnaA
VRTVTAAVRTRDQSENAAKLEDAERPAIQRHRRERAIELCDCLIDITSALFGISSKELRQIATGRPCLEVARIRQLAMYVAHVTLCLSMKDVGVGFGRDRTTVAHACHLIEDLRDDVEFDRMVVMTERIATAAFRNHLEMMR